MNGNMLQALLAQGGMGGMGAPSGGPTLLSFNCGRCNFADVPESSPERSQGRYKVTPRNKKGKIQISRDFSGTMEFKWLRRPEDTPESDTSLSVIPGEWKAELIDTKRPKDRCFTVYCAHRRFFFWFQTPDNQKDQDKTHIEELNKLLAGQDISATNTSGTSSAADTALQTQTTPAPVPNQGSTNNNNSDSNPAQPGPDFNAVLQSIDWSALSGVSNDSATPNQEEKKEEEGEEKEGDNQGAVNTEQWGSTIASLLGTLTQQQRPVFVPLSKIITSEKMLSCLEDEKVQSALLPLLPEEYQNLDDLKFAIQTPQLKAALRRLSQALMSGNYNNIMANFGLNPMHGSEAMARGDAIQAFLTAVQAQADQESNNDSSSSSAEDKEEE